MKNYKNLFMGLLAISLVVAGCNGGTGTTNQPQQVVTVTQQVPSTPSQADSEQISDGGTNKPTGTDVQITSPDLSKPINSPLKLTGKIKPNYSFEAVFPIRLENAAGKTIASGQGHVTTDDLNQEFVPFTAEIKFSQTAGKGSLVIMNDNPSGLPENDKKISLPVTFGATGAVSQGDPTLCKVYKGPSNDFQLCYPNDFTVKKGDTGILTSFVYPETYSQGTNLQFAHVDVTVPKSDAQCYAGVEGGQQLTKQYKNPNGVIFVEDRWSEGAAGHVGRQVSYNSVHNQTCYKLILTMYSSNLGMYEPQDAPNAYDEAKVEAKFKEIVDTFKFLK